MIDLFEQETGIKRQEIEKRIGAKLWTQWHEALDTKKPDTVFICESLTDAHPFRAFGGAALSLVSQRNLEPFLAMLRKYKPGYAYLWFSKRKETETLVEQLKDELTKARISTVVVWGQFQSETVQVEPPVLLPNALTLAIKEKKRRDNKLQTNWMQTLAKAKDAPVLFVSERYADASIIQRFGGISLWVEESRNLEPFLAVWDTQAAKPQMVYLWFDNHAEKRTMAQQLQTGFEQRGIPATLVVSRHMPHYSPSQVYKANGGSFVTQLKELLKEVPL